MKDLVVFTSLFWIGVSRFMLDFLRRAHFWILDPVLEVPVLEVA